MISARQSEDAHLKVYNVDNYNHTYYRRVVQVGRDHERFEGNFTGYGYTHSKVLTKSASLQQVSAFERGSVWPAGRGFADRDIYEGVRLEMRDFITEFNSADVDRTVAPNLFNRYETPLGHEEDRELATMTFQAGDLLEWNIAGQKDCF